MAEEITIPNFEYYTINHYGHIFTKSRICSRTDGKIYSQKRQIVKQTINCKNGRPYICLRNKYGKRKTLIVHRLGAIAFLPNPKNLPEVNHIDGNPLNNHVSNLEWVSRLDNMRHAHRNGLMHTVSGLNHPNYIDGWQKNDIKSYQNAFNRAKVRGLDWKKLSKDERISLLQAPKLTKWDTKRFRNG